ncbi:hypothetical protein DFJ74DRAFT_664385 [Hyaloraphidium curvatum]|nr:hypothetical protein DFJ74DRAFT_664385 [Hyaloraphidium curvatum]
MAGDYSVTSECIAKIVASGDPSRPAAAKVLFSVPVVNDEGLGKGSTMPDTPIPASFAKDSLVALKKKADGALQWELLADAGSARAALFELLHEKKVNPLYPKLVREETARWSANPDIDDPALNDLTHIPFCTIDNDNSRDLDQAMAIERDGDGFMVYYALADAAYYVYPGTALFDHALKRGTSYYLPMLSVPMLPPALSEDVVSLNANVPRRAVVFHMKLDKAGLPVSTTLTRSRILSRAKLSYRRVQEYYDGLAPEATNLAGKDFTETLDLLKEVGALRIKEAESRDVVRYDRVALQVDLSSESVSDFHLTTEKRYSTDRYNEQISLLCNREGATFLQRDADSHPEVQAIYRVHDAPDENRFGGVDKFIRDLIKVRGLPRKLWDWDDRNGEPISAYLERLPFETEEDKRIKAAIERQFLVLNNRSTYSGVPGLHYGLGVDPYARFSSPMREVVGIMTHKEALEKLGLPVTPALASIDPKDPAAIAKDEALREDVIKSADAARSFQNALGKAVDAMAIHSFFSAETAKPIEERTRYSATVMGLVPTRIYTAFDDPPLEIKVYLEDIEIATGKKWAATAKTEGARKAPLAVAMTEEDWTPPTDPKNKRSKRSGTGDSTNSSNSKDEGQDPAKATFGDVSPDLFSSLIPKGPIVVGDPLTCIVGGYDAERKRWAVLPVLS